MSAGVVLQYIWLMLGGFLLGNKMFSFNVSKLVAKAEICELSANPNPGSANIFTSCGWKMELFCYVPEDRAAIGKGACADGKPFPNI